MLENYRDNVITIVDTNMEKTTVRNTDHLKRTSDLFQEPNLERQLVKRLDRHILPLVCVLYCFSFLDRVNIGNAKIGGIEESLQASSIGISNNITPHSYLVLSLLTSILQLNPTQFSICLALFYVSYILFEVPANVLLKHFKVNLWISIIMFLWGGITIATAFVTSFPTLGTTRFFLGLFEAGYVPGIMYYLSTFYKRKELATRIAVFLSFNCIAGMISGPIGYASTLLEGKWGMHGWQFLFLIEGIPTTLLSICCYCFLVRDIKQVKWLSSSQKELQVQRIAQEKITSDEHALTWRQFKVCMGDWRGWMMGLLLICSATPLSGISLFLPTLLQDLGFSIGITQLLVIPINLVGAIAEISAACVADRLQRRFPLIFSGSILACVSFVALAVIHNNWIRYALLHFGVIGVTMGGPCIMTWSADNWAGPGKAVSIALIISLGHCGGIIASFIFRPSDAPNFVMPFVVFSIMMAAAAGISFLLRSHWNRLNTSRDLGVYEVDITDITSEQMDTLGDRHPAFRYIL